MIIIKIHGGLGNQMFQYALGRNLSLLHNVPFKIDSSYLRTPNQFGRTMELDKFNTLLEEARPEEVARYRNDMQKFLDMFRPEWKKKKISDIQKDVNAFYPEVLKIQNAYFDGHWNNEKYFSQNAATIRQDFTLKQFGEEAEKMRSVITAAPNATAVHIRRKDYVTNSKAARIFTSLSLTYYEQAINIILKKYPDASFFVFSDDIEWAKENFPKDHPITFITPNSSAEDMALQGFCKHNIIANSTFSWWGAWLNNNPEKTVIAPRGWFVEEKRNESEVTPPQWIRI